MPSHVRRAASDAAMADAAAPAKWLVVLVTAATAAAVAVVLVDTATEKAGAAAVKEEATAAGKAFVEAAAS